nr:MULTISPECIES: hypothetical protein [unclassified Mycolicibacterium]
MPFISAGILGGAALGLAGMASADSMASGDQRVRSSFIATPKVYAPPAIANHGGKKWGKLQNTSPAFDER